MLYAFKRLMEDNGIFNRKLTEMLKRYKISELFLGKTEHIKAEHIKEIEKRIWQEQTRKYIQEHGTIKIRPRDGD